MSNPMLNIVLSWAFNQFWNFGHCTGLYLKNKKINFREKKGDLPTKIAVGKYYCINSNSRLNFSWSVNGDFS